MRARKLVVVMAVAVACQQPPGPEAKVWTPREFFAKRTVTAPMFGGWAPSELLVVEGQRIPYTTRVQGPGEGLTVQPGVSAGRAVAFVITDIWEHHPDPWIQPVWAAATPAKADLPPAPREGVNTIFPVGLDSTFYSPWWRVELVPVPDDQVASLTSAREVLNRAASLVEGPLVLCPIISPATVRVATDGTGATRHPLTGSLLATPTPSTAWVDAVETPYPSFGLGFAPSDGQRLVESELFVFTRNGAGLPIAAVLPDDARAHAFLRRVEVDFPADAGVFVPSNRPDLREPLAGLAPAVDPSLDAFPEYALRVALDPACFSRAGFPASCNWLDSQDKVRALFGEVPPRRRDVLVTAPVLAERAP